MASIFIFKFYQRLPSVFDLDFVYRFVYKYFSKRLYRDRVCLYLFFKVIIIFATEDGRKMSFLPELLKYLQSEGQLLTLEINITPLLNTLNSFIITNI